AGRLPCVDYQSTGKRRVSNRFVHLGHFVREPKGQTADRSHGGFPQVGAHGRPKVRRRSWILAAPGKRREARAVGTRTCSRALAVCSPRAWRRLEMLARPGDASSASKGLGIPIEAYAWEEGFRISGRHGARRLSGDSHRCRDRIRADPAIVAVNSEVRFPLL